MHVHQNAIDLLTEEIQKNDGHEPAKILDWLFASPHDVRFLVYRKRNSKLPVRSVAHLTFENGNLDHMPQKQASLHRTIVEGNSNPHFLTPKPIPKTPSRGPFFFLRKLRE
jgi:hypothetical protein